MYALAISLALSPLAPPPLASDNPCTNGSFEKLAPSGFPADWGPVGRAVEVSSDAHSGERALRFRRAKETRTAETGLNRGPLIDRFKGGMDFWYKAVSANDTRLNVHVIPMNDEPLEGTGSPRATFVVPDGHVGDGRWHHGRLKYDFTDNPQVKWVHFAVRIVGTEGELLVDDVSYVERVGQVLRFGKIEIKEDAERIGERCTIRAEIENAGDAPAKAVRAEMVVHAVRDAASSERSVGDLAPDQKQWVTWTYEGERTAPCRLEFTAVSGDVETETSIALAPQLVLRSFGPTAPVVMQKSPVTLTCVLKNPGTASLVNPTAVFELPTGPVRRKAKRLHPGEQLSLSTRFTFDQQTPELPIAVRVSADNVAQELTAGSSLVVGPAKRLGPSHKTLSAAASEQFAILENEHVRLLFRRNEFGFGPAELAVCGGDGRPATIAWLPRLARVVLRGGQGSRREHIVLTRSPPKAHTGDRASIEFRWSTPEGEKPGCQVRVCFALAKGEKSISVDHELACSEPGKLLAFDGPMLYAVDRDEAVFPGLEWLVDEEVSSSTLDIAAGHPHQVRYVVHPNMVTIPAVGMHGERGTVGLVWDIHQKWDGQRDRPSVVFASPDRFENQRSHLVGLFLPSVPDFVEVNRREAAEPYPLEPGKPLQNGPRAGWRYDDVNAFLAIRVARDRTSPVEIQGAAFRLVCRLPMLTEQIAFEFDESSEGWVPAHHVASLSTDDGALTGKITGPDPYLMRMLVRASGDTYPVIRLRMRVTAGRGGQFFWTTESSPGFSEDKSVHFAIQPDGQFREHRLEPYRHPAWAGQTITALRIDPGNGATSGEFAVDYIRGDKR